MTIASRRQPARAGLSCAGLAFIRTEWVQLVIRGPNKRLSLQHQYEEHVAIACVAGGLPQAEAERLGVLEPQQRVEYEEGTGHKS